MTGIISLSTKVPGRRAVAMATTMMATTTTATVAINKVATSSMTSTTIMMLSSSSSPSVSLLSPSSLLHNNKRNKKNHCIPNCCHPTQRSTTSSGIVGNASTYSSSNIHHSNRRFISSQQQQPQPQASLISTKSSRQHQNQYHRSNSSNSNSSSSSSSSSSSTNYGSRNAYDANKSLRQQKILSLLEAGQKEKTLSQECEYSIQAPELDRHGRGESHHMYREGLVPDVIVYPSTVQDVSMVLQLCNAHQLSIIPYGAGTSVEGHVCVVEETEGGTISLDMTKGKDFQSIVLPGEGEGEGEGEGNGQDTKTIPDPIATVGAGVTLQQLNDALVVWNNHKNKNNNNNTTTSRSSSTTPTDLQFTVDPGAGAATLGGMVATGASGTTSVRYGTMRENILALQGVLPDGTILTQVGTHASKSSAGYDLVSLLCGSEGTLGVITSITLKLHPLPPHLVAAVCVFETLQDAAHTVAVLKYQDIPVVRCELLDATSVAAFNKANACDTNNSNTNTQTAPVATMEEKPTLFLEFQASSELALQEQIQHTEAICVSQQGSSFRFTSNEEERKALWSARHSLYYLAIRYREDGGACTTAIVTDVCVPLSKLAQIMEATVNDIQHHHIVGFCFGHAGDGNFHCIIPLKEGAVGRAGETDDYLSKVTVLQEKIIQRALAVGGTCSGEHGVGYGKRKYLPRQYGEGTMALMKLIKKAVDPNNIMNPGKVC